MNDDDKYFKKIITNLNNYLKKIKSEYDEEEINNYYIKLSNDLLKDYYNNTYLETIDIYINNVMDLLSYYNVNININKDILFNILKSSSDITPDKNKIFSKILSKLKIFGSINASQDKKNFYNKVYLRGFELLEKFKNGMTKSDINDFTDIFEVIDYQITNDIKSYLENDSEKYLNDNISINLTSDEQEKLVKYANFVQDFLSVNFNSLSTEDKNNIYLQMDKYSKGELEETQLSNLFESINEYNCFLALVLEFYLKIIVEGSFIKIGMNQEEVNEALLRNFYYANDIYKILYLGTISLSNTYYSTKRKK